ncbi:hypothetical protein ACFWFF_28055 [Streptomyces sp. NPDC060223]|uniref:hypothetical protein n=1 Tax=unclassified Streptomyces TaxID=2593676 RepID=UPI003626280E
METVLPRNPFGERVCGELLAKSSARYGDEAFWTLTMAIGHFCLFVPVALIGRPIGRDSIDPEAVSQELRRTPAAPVEEIQ